MPGRFDLRPLVGGVSTGLRKRKLAGAEKSDVRTRVILFGLPVLAGGASAWYAVELISSDQLIAGFALFAGAMLAAFSQVASWREKVTERKRRTGGVVARALDEAVAHILASIVVAAVATVAMVIVSNIRIAPNSPDLAVLTVRAFSSVGVAAGVYLVLSLVIIVNLLWDAYVKANPPVEAVQSPAEDKRESA